MEYIATLGIFGLCMVGMSVGVILSNRRLKGSCGGVGIETPGGHEVSCGACVKKEAEVCPSDDQLVALAQIANPNPRHHH